jgi:hypothetical protein
MFRCYKGSTRTNNSGDLKCHVVWLNLLITVKPGHDSNEARYRRVSRVINTERCDVERFSLLVTSGFAGIVSVPFSLQILPEKIY